MSKNLTMKFIFLIYLLFSVSKVFSQENVSGTVINSNDKNPVQYASVSIERRAVYQDADSSGRFKLSIFDSDTIVLSCIGFIEKRITGKSLKQNRVVELIPKDIVLPTVYTGKFNSIKVGINETKVSRSMSANLGEREEFATLIQVPTSVKVYTINKVSFVIRNKDRKSITCNPVRMHIYSVASNGSPGEELLKEDVVITEMNITKNRLEIELKDQDITLTLASFFVSIQWLSTNQQIDYKQPQISFTDKEEKSLTWLKGKFNNYQFFLPKTEKGKGWGNMMVQAEIIIRE